MAPFSLDLPPLCLLLLGFQYSLLPSASPTKCWYFLGLQLYTSSYPAYSSFCLKSSTNIVSTDGYTLETSTMCSCGSVAVSPQSRPLMWALHNLAICACQYFHLDSMGSSNSTWLKPQQASCLPCLFLFLLHPKGEHLLSTVSVRALQRNRTNTKHNYIYVCVWMDICMNIQPYSHTKIYFKELAHAIVGLTSLKSFGQTSRLEMEARTAVAVLNSPTQTSTQETGSGLSPLYPQHLTQAWNTAAQ